MTQARVLAVGVAPGVLWALVTDGVAIDGRSNLDGQVWSSGHGVAGQQACQCLTSVLKQQSQAVSPAANSEISFQNHFRRFLCVYWCANLSL